MPRIQIEVCTTGGWEKAVPKAVDFVTARRPAGLDPRPQSSFIFSQSQTVLTVFDRFYDLPEYMQSYNQPVKAVDEILSGLLDSSNSQSDHFLGSLALCHGPFTGHYWLVDGHQKLITLQLILAFGMHWAKRQGASQAALFDALKSCLWAEKAEEAPSRYQESISSIRCCHCCAAVNACWCLVVLMGTNTATGNVVTDAAALHSAESKQFKAQGLELQH
jgi:hypothetical protein